MRRTKKQQAMIKRAVATAVAVVLIVGAFFWVTSIGGVKNKELAPDIAVTPITEEKQGTTPEGKKEPPEIAHGDPDNNTYPYSIMSADWGSEPYNEGYSYYTIPNKYKLNEGLFPEVAQVYLWSLCKEAGVDYYMALALIETESGYRYDAIGDRGNSKGLMQIYEKFNKDRMERLGVRDLYNPYENMRVGVDVIKEIQDRYLESSGAHCVLMVYNRGASGAKKLWDKEIYRTEYSRKILQRADEIKQEIQGTKDK